MKRPWRSRPCVKCPFRSEFSGEQDYLRGGRRQGIVESMLSGGRFPCHETTDGPYNEERECAGAMLVLYRADQSSNYMRILERIGRLDPDELMERNADVELWTLDECLSEGEPQWH